MAAPRRVVALVVVLTVIGVIRGQMANRDDSAADESAPTDQGKYKAAGDEGLGAAIAIMLDNSGSMRDTARGDSRPKYEVARDALGAMLASTDSFVAKQAGFSVKVGLYYFS